VRRARRARTFELPDAASAPADLIERGRVLDGFYVPTRDPNGHPEGPPFGHYGSLQSTHAAALPVPTDVLVYTPAEWAAVTARGDRFAAMLERDVVWLMKPG
jgi:hypothetical protein